MYVIFVINMYYIQIYLYRYLTTIFKAWAPILQKRPDSYAESHFADCLYAECYYA